MTQEFEFRLSRKSAVLRGRLISPDDKRLAHRTVVMLTGDGPKGTRSLSWINMPPRLLRHGIASFLFDFEGLGFSDGDRRALTLTKGIEQFAGAMKFFRGQRWFDKKKLGVLASSFGASVLLASAPVANSFKAIGLKSPAPFLPDAYVSEVGAENLDKWAQNGFLEANGYSFEVLLDALRYDGYISARDIKVPVLITHGSDDCIVPIVQSKYLFQCLGGLKRLEVFEGVGHGYSEGDAWDRMADLFTQWFANTL